MNLYERIFLLAEQIPAGTVTTYGDLARMVGGGCQARTVGEAMNAIPKHRTQQVPWQRVINAQGGISTRGLVQRELLEAEGVVFDERGRTDLRRFGWGGPPPDWCEANGYTPLPARPDAPAEQLGLF